MFLILQAFQQVVLELWLISIGLIKEREDQQLNKKIKSGQRTQALLQKLPIGIHFFNYAKLYCNTHKSVAYQTVDKRVAVILQHY